MPLENRQAAMKNYQILLEQLTLQYSAPEFSGDTAWVYVDFQKDGKTLMTLPVVLLREDGKWKVTTHSVCSPDTSFVFLKLQALLDPNSQAANLLKMMSAAESSTSPQKQEQPLTESQTSSQTTL